MASLVVAVVVALSATASAWPNGHHQVSFGTLLARSSEARVHFHAVAGKKVNLRFAEDAISRALGAASDADAFAALDAIGQLGAFGKPPGLMDAINNMRCSVCWERRAILTHKKCVKFLTKTCKAGSVCGDVCSKFLTLLTKRCYDLEDPRAQERCDLYKYITGKDCPEPIDEDDRDADGALNGEDAFPDDPKETKDTDGDDIGDNADKDRDNDGVPNDEDAFPLDPEEWKDSDGDGIGDNADTDRDGDGCENDDDKYPDDPEKCQDAAPSPEPAEIKEIKAPAPAPAAKTTSTTTTPAPVSAPRTADRDGDGCNDDVDAFPDDPADCKDSDGDGVGDSKDPWPLNPKCFHATEPCEEEGKAEPTKHIDPATLNKLEKGLPAQGYNEHSHGLVEHNDGETYSGDWGTEWPSWNRESEQESIDRICNKHPNNQFCQNEKRKKHFNR